MRSWNAILLRFYESFNNRFFTSLLQFHKRVTLLLVRAPFKHAQKIDPNANNSDKDEHEQLSLYINTECGRLFSNCDGSNYRLFNICVQLVNMWHVDVGKLVNRTPSPSLLLSLPLSSYLPLFHLHSKYFNEKSDVDWVIYQIVIWILHFIPECHSIYLLLERKWIWFTGPSIPYRCFVNSEI